MKDIVIQLIGVFAWILLFLSYKQKNTKILIVFQVCSSALYVIHYLLLGAYSGLFVCTISFFYGLLLSISKHKKLFYYMLIPILTSGLYFFYNGILSILPIFSSFIDNYALTKNKKFILQVSILSYSLWVVYDIFVHSYSCMITDSLVALSNLSILLFNINLLKQDTKKVMRTREELFK